MGFSNGFSRNMDIDFTGIYSMVRENIWQILASGLIAALILMSILMTIPQKYQGTTTILIDNREFAFNGLDKMMTQAAIIHSGTIVQNVIEKLGLSDEAFFGIQKKLKISTDKSARILQVQFTSNDPVLASRVPNAIADEYLATPQTKTVNAYIIARATPPNKSGILVNMLFAALANLLAMGLYIAAIIISALISGAGLKPSGKISRELVPDAVQNLPEFAA